MASGLGAVLISGRENAACPQRFDASDEDLLDKVVHGMFISQEPHPIEADTRSICLNSSASAADPARR